MQPTAKLRFINRELAFNPITGDSFPMPSKYQILQQWWEPVIGWNQYGEWRDVPLEKE